MRQLTHNRGEHRREHTFIDLMSENTTCFSDIVRCHNLRGLSPWEGKYSTLYFQHLQIGSRKMYVHALHTVHALPDLRVAAGRLRDGVSSKRAYVISKFDGKYRGANSGGKASLASSSCGSLSSAFEVASPL